MVTMNLATNEAKQNTCLGVHDKMNWHDSLSIGFQKAIAL